MPNSRRSLSLLLGLTLTWLGQASALQAATSSNVNLRTAPSTSARVLTVIPKATVKGSV